MNELVIDGKGASLGRLASFSAKQAMLGKKIVIVNCDEVIITGNPKSTTEEYKNKRKIGGSNMQGPYFSKSPERLVKRTIRGMLSYKQGRGKEAFKRIMCFRDVPEEYKDSKKILAGKEKRSKTIKLRALKENI